MMLRFQWGSLRRGDHTLVHDVGSRDLGLRPAIVELVVIAKPAHVHACVIAGRPDPPTR